MRGQSVSAARVAPDLGHALAPQGGSTCSVRFISAHRNLAVIVRQRARHDRRADGRCGVALARNRRDRPLQRRQGPVRTARRGHRRSGPTTQAHHDAASPADRPEQADPDGRVYDAGVESASGDTRRVDAVAGNTALTSTRCGSFGSQRPDIHDPAHRRPIPSPITEASQTGEGTAGTVTMGKCPHSNGWMPTRSATSSRPSATPSVTMPSA